MIPFFPRKIEIILCRLEIPFEPFCFLCKLQVGKPGYDIEVKTRALISTHHTLHVKLIHFLGDKLADKFN